MEHLLTIGLLDTDGQPFHPRIERVLIQLLPRLRREFPSLQDEVGLTEIMEEAGRRIRHREKHGPIERLHGYAWVTVRSIATSRMRLGSSKLAQKILDSEASNARLLAIPTSRDTAAEVEQAVLLRELLQTLSQEERMICLWKKAGFSSQEIALHQRRTVVAVDTIFSRAKQKIRKALGVEDAVSVPSVRSSTK
jgi:DNA-directed RNA polymerase specialized sigma24 family protein